MVSSGTDKFSQKAVRIMVVEDVAFNLEILTSILAERGYQTVAATSGEAALDILAQDTDFQIILMDIGLPGIDGVETTRRIKGNPACRAIPVIALTAETATERDRLLAAGLDGYAEKNFDPDQLFVAIERHLVPACGKHQETGPSLAVSEEHLDLDFETLLANYANEETISRIAKAFFTDTDRQIILLEKAMTQGNQPAILACCHSIMGSAAIFTAHKLGAATKELDACIRCGKTEEAGSAWPRVLAAHESLHQAVADHCKIPCP